MLTKSWGTPFKLSNALRCDINMQPLRRIVPSAHLLRPSFHTTRNLLPHIWKTANPAIDSVRLVRSFSASAMIQDPFKPAARVAGQRQDVW